MSAVLLAAAAALGGACLVLYVIAGRRGHLVAAGIAFYAVGALLARIAAVTS